jgi:DTW domain-containing protein YfiP
LNCWRPKNACFCAAIPSIDNRTKVLIVQHRRERFHPFNTARIVHRSLRNSRLLVDHPCNLATRLHLEPGAGLLYPGSSAQRISDLPLDQRPEQLVILDGTWHHAKALFREIPALRLLPRYALAPTAPSRYRIRRAPNNFALSTIEAAVAALRILEPETDGLDQLLMVFNAMVEGQLTIAGYASKPRFQKRRNRTFKNIPVALLGDLRNIVVAYAEAPAGQRGCKRKASQPIYCVAQRLVSDEIFLCALTPPCPLDDSFLGHLELSREDFADAVSLAEAQRRWSQFRRATDIVAVFQPGTARLFSYLSGGEESCLVLKSVDLASDHRHSSLEDQLAEEGVQSAPVQHPGRAGKRLANAIALVRHLNALGNSRYSDQPFISK